MDELVEWLRAQLDEDEQIARAAGGTWWAPPDLVGEVHDSGGVNIDAKLKSFAAHIEAWDPARVLREIDAKRQILGRVLSHAAVMGRDEVHWDLLRLLALPYADRPGYREEWRV
ncbi:DUF6221 family protein [Streptomyces spiralis]